MASANAGFPLPDDAVQPGLEQRAEWEKYSYSAMGMALIATRGRVAAAAQRLGCARSTVYKYPELVAVSSDERESLPAPPGPIAPAPVETESGSPQAEEPTAARQAEPTAEAVLKTEPPRPEDPEPPPLQEPETPPTPIPDAEREAEPAAVEEEPAKPEAEVQATPLPDVPTPQSVIAHLRSTGTGARTLDLVQQWIDENPDADGEAMLRWAEDLHAKDHWQMMDGTLRKIGRAVVGESYGGAPLSMDAIIRTPNALPPLRVRTGIRRVKPPENQAPTE